MVADVVVIHFKRNRHSQNTEVGTLRSVQVVVEKNHNDLFVSVLRILYLIYCINADLSVLWHVLDCSIGLTCVAWSSDANAPKARTRPRTRTSRTAWQGDSRLAADKGVLFRRPVPLRASTKPCMVNKFGVYEFQANYQANQCIILKYTYSTRNSLV